MDNYRTWGDGVGRTKAHIIGDISFTTPDNWVVCANDGTIIMGTAQEIERGWNLHRGMEPDTIRLRQFDRERASDGEVSEFLRHLEDPRFVSHQGASNVQLPNDGLEDAFDLLDRVRMLGELCTCASEPIEVCPNYMEGDDDN